MRDGKTCGKTAFAIISLSISASTPAGVDDMVQAIANSNIRFTFADSYVPFIPVAWVKYQHYTDTQFIKVSGLNPGEFREQYLSAGLVLPVYVAQNDIVVAGFDASFTQFNFDAPVINDASVITITPVAGWLRQLDDDSQLSAFFAPRVSSALNDNSRWGVDAYAGVIGTYQANNTLMWFYGGVYENSFGQHYFFPYAGMRWTPDPHWAVSLIAPWPTISYAPNRNLFVSIGASPGGAAWRMNASGDEAVMSFGSWNLSAGAGYQLSHRLWLHAEAGVAGLRSAEITSDGDSRLDADIQRHPVFSLALEFRP